MLFEKRGSSHSLWINPQNGVIEAVPVIKKSRNHWQRKFWKIWLGNKFSADYNGFWGSGSQDRGRPRDPLPVISYSRWWKI